MKGDEKFACSALEERVWGVRVLPVAVVSPDGGRGLPAAVGPEHLEGEVVGSETTGRPARGVGTRRVRPRGADRVGTRWSVPMKSWRWNCTATRCVPSSPPRQVARLRGARGRPAVLSLGSGDTASLCCFQGAGRQLPGGTSGWWFEMPSLSTRRPRATHTLAASPSSAPAVLSGPRGGSAPGPAVRSGAHLPPPEGRCRLSRVRVDRVVTPAPCTAERSVMCFTAAPACRPPAAGRPPPPP